VAYTRTNWKDHVVQRPKTFTKVENSDGSVTLKDAPGEVLQQGTPQSATNFNHAEEGLEASAIAFDMQSTIDQALLRDALNRVEKLEAKVNALS